MAHLDHHSSTSSQYVQDDRSTSEAKLEFSEDEQVLIARMFNLVGERWSLIAGRIPGRTAKEIHKYWTSRFDKRMSK